MQQNLWRSVKKIVNLECFLSKMYCFHSCTDQCFFTEKRWLFTVAAKSDAHKLVSSDFKYYPCLCLLAVNNVFTQSLN